MKWDAKGSSEREMLPIWSANLLQQRLGLDPWALEKIQQDGLSVLGQMSDTCQKCLQCAWKHKLSSYYRMYKSEVFSSMRAISSH